MGSSLLTGERYSGAVFIEEDGTGASGPRSQARSSSWVQRDLVHRTDPEYTREEQTKPTKDAP